MIEIIKYIIGLIVSFIAGGASYYIYSNKVKIKINGNNNKTAGHDIND